MMSNDESAAARPRIERLVVALVVAWLFVRTAMLVQTAWPFSTDDAYITLRYARHLAEGHGIVWNVGEPPVEGYSNFTFVLMGAALMRLGVDPVLGFKVFSLLCMGVTCVLLYRLARRWLGPLPSLLPVAFLTATHGQIWWTVSGMETAVFQMLAVAAVVLAFRGMRFDVEAAPETAGEAAWSVRDLVGSGLIAAVAGMTRPEGPLVAIGITLGLVAQAFRRARGAGGTWPSRADLRATVAFGAAFGLPYAAYFAWRLATFGRWLPNTVHCKSGYLRRPFKLINAYWQMAAVHLLFAVIVRLRRLDGRHVVLWSIPLLYGVALFRADPLLGHYNRHFLAAHALVLVASAVGMITVLELVPGSLARFRREAILVTVVLVYLGTGRHRIGAPMEEEATRYVKRMETRRALGEWLSENLEPGQRYLIGDAGLVPYLTPGPVDDVLCLNNLAMTSPPIDKDREAFVESVYADPPEYAVVHSKKARSLKPRKEGGFYPKFVRHPQFRRVYRRHEIFETPDGSFHYFVYRRHDVPSPGDRARGQD